MSVTVYGCVNANSTITFENLETCLLQSTCIVWTGEHAGQVALALSGATNAACNDTFYGCINFSTSKFQMEIPSDCCIPWCICQCSYANYCSHCFPLNKSPQCVEVIFTGIKMCSDDSLSPLNDIHFCLVYTTPSECKRADDCSKEDEYISCHWLTRSRIQGFCIWHSVACSEEFIGSELIAILGTYAGCDDCASGSTYWYASDPNDCIFSFSGLSKPEAILAGYPAYGGVGNVTNPCLQIGGSLSPNATCNYTCGGLYNDRIYYKRIVDSAWIIWWNGVNSWIISTILGTLGTAYWQRINTNVLGDYQPQGIASGTATVSFGIH